MNGKGVIELLKAADLTSEQIAKLLAFTSTRDNVGMYEHWVPTNVTNYLQKALGQKPKKEEASH